VLAATPCCSTGTLATCEQSVRATTLHVVCSIDAAQVLELSCGDEYDR